MSKRARPLRRASGKGAGGSANGSRARALGVFLAGVVVLPVLHVMGCGARSSLEAPGAEGAGGAVGCTETQTAAVSASIGGGIHHVYTECLPKPDGGVCPDSDEAKTLIKAPHCFAVEEIQCGPIVKPEECCYVALEVCGLT